MKCIDCMAHEATEGDGMFCGACNKALLREVLLGKSNER